MICWRSILRSPTVRYSSQMMDIPHIPCDSHCGVDINNDAREEELAFEVVGAPEYDDIQPEPLDRIMDMYMEEMQADKRRKLSMEDKELTLRADSGDQSTAYSSSSSLAREQTTPHEDDRRKDDQQPINMIALAHPLHIDFMCSLCAPPLSHSIGQKILDTRSNLLNPASKEAAVMIRVHAAWSPFTEDELARAYRNLLCPHQIIEMLRAPPDIVYEGEPDRPESRLAGNIIRQIAADLSASARRGYCSEEASRCGQKLRCGPAGS